MKNITLCTMSCLAALMAGGIAFTMQNAAAAPGAPDPAVVAGAGGSTGAVGQCTDVDNTVTPPLTCIMTMTYATYPNPALDTCTMTLVCDGQTISTNTSPPGFSYQDCENNLLKYCTGHKGTVTYLG